MVKNTTPTNKKRLVVSYRNMTSELQEQVKAEYPLGFSEKMMRIDKPNGDFFYAVPFETEEINYLVKIDVKIDDKAKVEEEEEKGYYEEEELKGADELPTNGDEGDGDDDF